VEVILKALAECRGSSERSAQTVRETRTAAGSLLEQAKALAEVAGRPGRNGHRSNGR